MGRETLGKLPHLWFHSRNITWHPWRNDDDEDDGGGGDDFKKIPFPYLF